MAQHFTRIIRTLRQLSGGDAYERYLSHHAQAHHDEIPLNRREFFKQEQERKWNGVRRCC
ncbi:MAG: YbdD/YjiX family protein [Gammaproteobacteria bacterium]|nr:YbdD/YjiX family protein [Gammaproteobacteria bacterium]